MPNAARVGLLVIIFVGLLFAAYAAVGRTIFQPPVDRYFADFGNAAGVTRGTPVLMAGVQIGMVTEIRLMSPTLARMTLQINRGIEIPAGSVATIQGSLIGLGESPIEIVPPEQMTTRILAPGDVLPGDKGNPLREIMPDLDVTIGELNQTLAATRELLQDRELRDSVQQLLVTSDRTLQQFGGLAGQVDGLVAENRAMLRHTLRSATAAAENVRRTSASVARLAEDPRLREDLRGIVADLRATSRSADELVRSVQSLVDDPAMRQDVRRTTANVAEITETGREIATNTQEITGNLAVVSERAITLTERATEVADRTIEIQQQLQTAIDRVGGFFTRSPGAGILGGFEAQMDLMHETRPAHWRTDVTVSLPLPGSPIRVGLFDAFESNRLILQFERPLSPALDLRYGIYASKASLGVDYQAAPRLHVVGDLFDINNPRLDLRARYDFGNGVHGWFGFDRIFRETSPTFGVGIRR